MSSSHAVSAVAGLVCAIAVTLWSCPTARAWVPNSAVISASKATAAPDEDPSLSDPRWKQGLTFDSFYNITAHRPAEHSTTVQMLYDDRNLYLAFHCDQHGLPIVATQTVDHAGVNNDDHVTLGLETSGNGGRMYKFRASPRGIHDEYSSENARYAPNWRSIARILPNGDWNLVMVIPLRNIRAQGGVRQSWKINFVRFLASTNDAYTWAYEETMSDVDSPQYWPRLLIDVRSTAARPQPAAQIFALGTAGADRSVFQNGIGNFESMKVRPYGLDATVPLTNTLAFVGTLNPDFSNVEQDQTTIAPQEFQRQYIEYRTFFAQGAGFVNAVPGVNVNSSDVPFYSPKIGVFDRGLKVEGTQGLDQIGILNAIGDGVNDSALGFRYERPDNSFTFAVTGVDANHPGIRDETFGYGIATTNPHDGVFAIAKLASDRGTNISAPAEGDDLQLAGGVQNAHTLLVLKYQDIGPQYAPLDGYVTQNDARGPQVSYQYTGSGGANGSIKSYQFNVTADRFMDRTGAAHETDVIVNGTITSKGLLSLGYGSTTSRLREYQLGYPSYAGAAVLPFDSESFSVGYRDGTPAPIDLSYSTGPFANNALQPVFLQQPGLSTSQQFGRWGANFAYSGAIERSLPNSTAPSLDSQWLRNVSVTRSFGNDASFAIGLRDVSGRGGYASPGMNLAISFHARFKSLDELYVDYGTPAAVSTLNRFIVKYLFNVGGELGT